MSGLFRAVDGLRVFRSIAPNCLRRRFRFNWRVYLRGAQSHVAEKPTVATYLNRDNCASDIQSHVDMGVPRIFDTQLIVNCQLFDCAIQRSTTICVPSPLSVTLRRAQIPRFGLVRPLEYRSLEKPCTHCLVDEVISAVAGAYKMQDRPPSDA